MRKSMRLGLTVMVAMVALAAMVANASATHLSISSQRFRIIWTSLLFENTARAGQVLCPVTLEGTFHSATIAKTVGSLIGYITRASVRGERPPCTGGTATILQASLPWHITYEGFVGTLPRLEGVQLLLVGAAFQVHIEGSLTCLARTEVRHPAFATANVESGGRVIGLTPEEGHTIPLTEGSFGCPLAQGLFKREGVGTVSTETGGAISVTLI